MLKNYSETARRVCRKRFEEYWQEYFPDDTKLKSLLEHWRNQGLIRETEAGYALEPMILKAVDEGLIPVALTGDFLRRMTSNGFFWVPGIKYRRGTILADIDVMAVCDGSLVLAECKEMEQAPDNASSWESEIWPQFEELIEVAKVCRADVVALASLADSYPKGWYDRAKARAGTGMGILLLTKDDLDSGYRDLPQQGEMPARPMFIRDVRIEENQHIEQRNPPGPRIIRSPLFTAHYGG